LISLNVWRFVPRWKFFEAPARTAPVKMENLTRTLGSIGPLIGPILRVIRGGEADPLEKFFYVTMSGPLVIVAVSLRYVGDTKNLLKEPDSISRDTRLEEKRAGFRKLLLLLLVASSVLVGAAAWLLLRSN
jgi:hypothetical protein